MELRSILARLFALGAGPGLSTAVRGRIVLSNQIAAIVVVIALVAIGTGDWQRERSLLYGYSLLAAAAVAAPVLNAIGHATASRLVLVVCPPLILLGAGVLGGAGKLGYVLAFPYALIAISLLPLLLFHAPSEKLPWRVGVVLVGSILLGHDWLLARTLGEEERRLLGGIMGDTKAAQMILWGLIIASVQFALHAHSYAVPEQRKRSGPDSFY